MESTTACARFVCDQKDGLDEVAALPDLVPRSRTHIYSDFEKGFLLVLLSRLLRYSSSYNNPLPFYL
jgi:hypothetical protein